MLRFLLALLASPPTHLEARMTLLAQQDAEREQHRAEVIEALAKANTHAKRQQYVIEKFQADRPTKWTTAHRYLDQLLTDLESCG